MDYCCLSPATKTPKLNIGPDQSPPTPPNNYLSRKYDVFFHFTTSAKDDTAGSEVVTLKKR